VLHPQTNIDFGVTWSKSVKWTCDKGRYCDSFVYVDRRGWRGE